jgi:signal transduction histidine kinase/flagellar motor switch protein FliG
MEWIIIGLLPVLLLLTAAAIFVVNQISSYFQFMGHSRREKASARMIRHFLDQVAAANIQLAARKRELEAAAHSMKMTNQELARLNNMKSKFLSMAVHDVRTPLTSVNGYAQMLAMRGTLGPMEKRFVENIRKASEQISRLLGDLTDLALIEAGKMRIEHAPFEASAMLGDLLPSFSLIAQTKKVNLVSPDLPSGLVITGDRYRLGRVLANLLGNAIKFTPAGGTVELHVRQAGAQVLFSIKDTGPGIHPTERRQIFEKFYQSRFGSTKDKMAGWGLGLAISDEIIRGHWGAIGVDSPGLGRGSTFWFRVPVRPPARRMRGGRLAAAAAAALFAFCAASARADLLPLDEKARFEHALEERAQGVLLNLIGPNRSKVVVDAKLDFTQTEKYESHSGSAAAAAGAGGYLWVGEPEKAAPELLPGLPTPSGGPSRAPQTPQNYERQHIYPTEFVKKLSVTVVVDQTLPPSQSEEIRAIVTKVLDVSVERGDSLIVVRASFMPVWKQLWYQPEMAAQIAKYLLITVLSLLTLAVVAISLMKLTAAMQEMAHTQSQQISMDMNSRADGRASEALEGGGDATALLENEDNLNPAAGGEAAIRFDVRPDQIEALADMLAKEDAANVALIAAHLEPEIRRGLLTSLPEKLSDDVYASLGRVRYVEPNVIADLKEELERRLAGAVGGFEQLMKLIESTEYSEKARLLRSIAATDPQVARRLRAHVFLIEDLEILKPEEWSQLLGRVTSADWASALADGPAGATAALQAQLNSGAWEVVSQMMASPAPVSRRKEAQEKIGGAVLALAKEGIIADLPARLEERASSEQSMSLAVVSTAAAEGDVLENNLQKES